MSSSSDPGRDSPEPPDSFEDVLANFLRATKSGGQVNRSEWFTRYPQHADELRAFIAGHEQMEDFAGEMRQRRKSVVTASPFGTEIKYVGEYELLEQLGQGGMGIVFKARQASLDRLVALKVLLDDSRDHDRIRMEAETAAALDLILEGAATAHELQRVSRER